MERLLLGRLDHLHQHPSPDSTTLLRTQACCGALISNPSSTDLAVYDVFDGVVSFLGRDHHHHPSLRPAIVLLGRAAVLHRALLPPAVAAVRPLLSCGERHVAEALSVLLSVAETSGEGLARIRSALGGDDLVLSLASSRHVAVRSLLLKLLVLDADRGAAESLAVVRPRLVLRVVAGLTADLYPSVRCGALDGLLALCTNAGVGIEVSVMQSCYDVAVTLLRDVDTFVRITAIRLVSELGQMLAAAEEGTESRRRSDALFLTLCSFARDLDMKVRFGVFVALGKVKLVSENVLLQSLSKKMLRSSSSSKLAENNVEESGPSLSCAAGVFVHGLEDEFHEVRKAACDSLGKFTILSAKFADNALNFLMDMLNDDSAAVQLQCLQTLLQMATHSLNVQERDMHTFLGTLANNSAPIRSATRNVIRLMKLPSMEIFRSSIDGLINNFKMYPEDEEDVLGVLFCIGKAHGKFAGIITNKFIQEINPTSLGDLNLDRPQVVALLVLALSSTFSNEKLLSDVPARICSYAMALLGRISHSLQSSMSQDALLAYLCKHGGFPYSEAGIASEEARVLQHESSDLQFKKNPLDLSGLSFLQEMKQGEIILYEKLTVSAAKQILRTAAETWPMIKAQCIDEVLKTLRACKEELEMISWAVNATSRACLAFTFKYVQVVELIAEVWEQMQLKDPHIIKMRKLDFLLEKLETCLGILRYCFPGLSKEEECHVLELTLLGCVLRISKARNWADPVARKMQFIISRLELLYGEVSDLPDFAKELKNLYSLGGMSDTSFCTHNNDTSDLIKHFTLEQMMFSGNFRHTKAELQVLSDDSELPSPFISGLPVGITFRITLYNVSKNERVWLRMAVGESIQYAFLNLSQFDGSVFERRCTVNIPFYQTPKAASFLLNACVCLECRCEYFTQNRKGRGGPRCNTLFICEEEVVYLAGVDKIVYE